MKTCTLKKLQFSPHPPTRMVQRTPINRWTFYCGRSYVGYFDCPVCGREIRQNLNYLGQHKLVCNGVKSTKE